MSQADPLFTFWKYLAYLNKAADAHQLHSPLVFDLYQRVLKNPRAYKSERIEALRSDFKRNSSTVNAIDFKNKTEKATTVKHLARTSVSSPKFSMMLKGICEFLDIHNALECGTSLGINAQYMADADSIQNLVSLEGNKEIAQFARSLDSSDKLEIVVGNVYDTFIPAVKQNPELVFLDADHRSTAIDFYLTSLTPILDQIKVIIIHDIYWSRDMHMAWQAAIDNPRFSLTVDIFQAGLIFPNINAQKQHFIVKF